MPKIIELTLEIDVQRVSCPGVWLCQDGRVSLTVFALGTSYQTCLLPPIFPLMFKDVFYFRKRFQETCALNNICCLLKDETIYCELVQWCDDCTTRECIILAQYLGALNDVLFPPNMCSNEGVDLLMRRSKDFPGILAPKIEIATKVRIDEVWNQVANGNSSMKVSTCDCLPQDEAIRQKQVCHSARYHRNKCPKYASRPTSMTRSRSRSGSTSSRSYCSLTAKNTDFCRCPNPPKKGTRPRPSRHLTPRRSRKCRDYCVFNVNAPSDGWMTNSYAGNDDDESRSISSSEKFHSRLEDEHQRTILESRYIDRDRLSTNNNVKEKKIKKYTTKVSPCVCEICIRYHELFHTKTQEG